MFNWDDTEWQETTQLNIVSKTFAAIMWFAQYVILTKCDSRNNVIRLCYGTELVPVCLLITSETIIWENRRKNDDESSKKKHNNNINNFSITSGLQTVLSLKWMLKFFSK